MASNRGRFASRTAFEALQVEEIESDEEVVVQEQPKQVRQPTSKASPSKNASATTDKKTAKHKASVNSATTPESQPPNTTTETSKPASSKEPTKSAATNGSNGVNGHKSLASAAVEKLGAQSKVVPTPSVPFAAQAPKQGNEAVQHPTPSVQPPQPKAEFKTEPKTEQPKTEQPKTEQPKTEQPKTEQPKTEQPQLILNAALKTVSAQRSGESKVQTSQSTTQKQQSQEDAAAASKAKWKKIYERTLFTLIMIAGFVALVLLGHPYMILLVMVSQTLVYREIVALFNIPGRPSVTGGGGTGRSSHMSSAPTSAATSEDEEEERIQSRLEGRREELWSKALSWYFFAVANYFLYGESIIYYFKHIVFVDAYFIPFARHHRFLSFMLYVFGFMAFVSNLKRRNLKHQFGLFCWVHMSLLLIVFSSHFIVNNILEGLIWIWVPASLVVCNDVFAYICGMTFGKTPLIDLSPKKTVEGFVGAFIITEIFAYGWATFFQRYNYMICPAVSLGMNAFKEITCDINPVFHWHYLPLPPAIASLASSVLRHRVAALPWSYFQLHALVMAAFASLVAPFGGFFASGFKRAFNIKDFGDSIPGHGGLTDRFDCQFLMGLFSYVYYSSLIREHHVTVGSVLQTVVTQLTLEDQMELYNEISRYLVGQGKLVK
ncbi:related to CDS1 - CDP-diacylglycerol synthase [Ustilago bromivora]|uniref:Phosphatidate cytidylyltransferase n=1 Tax=Ustilago bromivora TaxID=307758 RepID=A0A8H8QUR3_9BASI|nr:related to CDS1 - CDP-diacylglycerol synthase [Ustilago bromivora]